MPNSTNMFLKLLENETQNEVEQIDQTNFSNLQTIELIKHKNKDAILQGIENIIIKNDKN